jgi:hypothetical protein
MELKPKQIKLLCSVLKNTYETRTGQILVVKTSPARYDDLADQIQNRVKSEWLARLFTVYQNSVEKVNINEQSLNVCCQYIGFSDISKFLSDKEGSDSFYGNYRVFWTESITTDMTPKPLYGFDVEITPTESNLKEDGHVTYKGGRAIKKKDTLYIELSQVNDSEKVYFLLSIGNIDSNQLEYIPGIFAAGDRANIVPCSGPVMLVKYSKEPNEQFIREYFSIYSGNNLIKSRSISDVLELSRKIELNTDFDYGKKTGKHSLFKNKTFFLYNYRENSDNNSIAKGVSRAVLVFHKNVRSVELRTFMGTLYTGSSDFFLDKFLILRLEPSDTRERALTIHFRIGGTLSKKDKYMIGTYCSFTGRGAPIAGIIVAELTQEKEPLPLEILNTPDMETQVNPNIKNFFKNKLNNEINTRAKGIFNDDDFSEFFQQQKYKFGRKGLYNNVFIAYPMSSNIADFAKINDIAEEVKNFIKKELKAGVFYAGETLNKKKGFNQSYLAANIDFNRLNESDLFILIHPRSVPSSTLVEAGWALAQGKTTLIFYKDQNDLPFILRDVKHLSYVHYFKFSEIEHLYETIKEALIWLKFNTA